MPTISTLSQFENPRLFKHLATGMASALLLGITTRRLSAKSTNRSTLEQGVYMFDRKPANWTTVKKDGTCEVQVSDGGAFRIIDENKRQLFCIPVRNLSTVMALLSGITHEELEQYESQVAKTKEAAKITKQLSASVAKAQKLAQAAKDQLIASGMTPEQAESFLQGKAG